MYGHWHLLQFFTLPSAPHSYSLDSDPLGVWGQARRAVLWAWWIFILIKYLFMCPRNSESPPGSLLLHVPEQRWYPLFHWPLPNSNLSPDSPVLPHHRLSCWNPIDSPHYHHHHMKPLWRLAQLMFPSLAWSLEKIPSLLPLAEGQLSPNTAQWLLTLKALRPEENIIPLGTQFSIESSVSHRPELNRKHLTDLFHNKERGETHLRSSASAQCFYTRGDHFLDISNIGSLSPHFGIGTCSANIVLF